MTAETTREAGRIAVSRDDLTEALDGFYLTVRYGSHACKGQVADPAGVAGALHATLSRIAAERAPDWTPEQLAEFQARFDAAMANPGPLRVLPPDPVTDAERLEAAAAVLNRRYPATRPDELDHIISSLLSLGRTWRRMAADAAAEAEAGQ